MRRRSLSDPVCDDVAVPLSLRPADARAGAARGDHADDLAPNGRRGVAAVDEVLRDAAADQLRDRRRDRPRPGVRGRHQLAVFFARVRVEAPFLGLWVFGWNRLSPRIHLATLWIAVAGTWLSGYFILVANSWMQHPVGYKTGTGEARLTSVWALLSNGFALRAYLHTMLAGLIFGSS